MRRRSACRQLLIGTSIRRYLPPIGTAGFERCWVRGKSREPCPPPRMIASTSFMSLHDAHEEQNELENQDRNDGRFEKLSANHAEVLDGEPVDVVECLQFLADVRLPPREIESCTEQREEPRRVDVADDLQRV